ncbi:MAG: peptidoglycan editing factor PgeF [Actinomycetes bacterium]
MADQVRVRTLFTTRRTGASVPPYDEANLGDHVGDDPAAVRINRIALETRLGAPIVWMDQVHGNDVAVVDAARVTAVPGVDALVTTQPNIGLGVLVADCVPVLLADANANIVAAAHVGRRGLVAGTAARAVDAMRERGAPPVRIEAWLGPAICGKCYEVPAAMQAEVEAAAPGSAVRTRAGTPGVELRAALRRQLHGVGVSTIHDVGPCTAESTEHYSFRRDGVTGRFAGVIVLASRDAG